MHRYVIRRLIAMAFMLIGVSLCIFVIMELAPGGPEMMFLAHDMDFSQVEEIRRNLGLDQPAHVRYLKWIWAAIRGDFGRSLTGAPMPVTELIGERIGATMLLMGTSLLVAVTLGVTLGVISAVRQYSWVDRITTMYAYFGMSFPSFWLGIMLIFLFALRLGWFPSSGMSEYGLERNLASRLSHLVLPVVTQATIWVGAYTRFIRSSILDVLHSDYIRTARSKGLHEGSVLFKHALRNALIPFITVLGLSLPSMLAGSVFVETIFAWPGLGRLTVQSVYRRDYPVIMGVCVLVSVAVIIGNLAADLAYGLADPRITYE